MTHPVGAVRVASVAVLDGSVTNRRIFRNVLGKGGFEHVVLVEQASAIVGALEREKCRLLIAQKKMLTQGTFELLRTIRNKFPIERLPILVTAYQFTSREAVDAIRHGASELLLLPFSPDALMRKVDAVTGGAVDDLGNFREALA